jgi:hypothetical protein
LRPRVLLVDYLHGGVLVQQRPQLNWPYLGFVIVIAFLGLGFIAVSISIMGFSDLTPEQNAWARLLVDVLCLGMFLGTLNSLRRTASTVFDDKQISQTTLSGVKTLRWIEVRDVRGVAYGVHLHGSQTRIILAPHAYADPTAFMRAIAQHLPHLSSPSRQRATAVSGRIVR